MREGIDQAFEISPLLETHLSSPEHSEKSSAAVGLVAVLLASYFASADIDQREKNIERIWGITYTTHKHTNA